MSLPMVLQRLRAKQGTALIIALLVLIVLTLIGVYAVFTSTVETRIVGNERLLEDAFYAADGGTDYGRRIIELILNNKSLPGGATPHSDDYLGVSLQDEVTGFDPNWENTYIADDVCDHRSPWVASTIGNCNMTIHVDRIKRERIPGSSAEYGRGQGETKWILYYQIDSTSTGTASSQSRVKTTYRRVVH
ncbi:MAG: pilus assembly PilX N-terminal domain-containing protein [Deltaproteobacteria bacterium]|nr:pilus assembly PilX N-terminal domain-containing protein [Deltaproteobacteria bacterium]